MKIKEYTRSPSYGKFSSFTPTGKPAHIELLELEVEGRLDTYKLKRILQMAEDAHTTVSALIDSTEEMSKEIETLQKRNKTLTEALVKMNKRLTHLENANKI